MHSHLTFLLSTMVILSLLAAAAPGQTIAAGHYFTFDDQTPGVLANGTVYTPISPERFDFLDDQVVTFAPGSATDGPAIAAPTLASPLQGGQVLDCEITGSGGMPTNSDEGLWVEMTNAWQLPLDLTVEAMFYTTNPALTETTVGLQYIVTTEWPFGEVFQGQLRILGDGGAVGRPADSQHLEWNTGDAAGEVRVVSANPIIADTWYHVVGTFDYNEADPANSTIELLLAAGAVATPADSQGTAVHDASTVTVTWGAVVTPSAGVPNQPNYDPKARYWIGSSPNNTIGGGDRRGLDGEIDAVAVTGQVGTIYLPDPPPAPVVTSAPGWTLYR